MSKHTNRPVLAGGMEFLVGDTHPEKGVEAQRRAAEHEHLDRLDCLADSGGGDAAGDDADRGCRGGDPAACAGERETCGTGGQRVTREPFLLLCLWLLAVVPLGLVAWAVGARRKRVR